MTTLVNEPKPSGEGAGAKPGTLPPEVISQIQSLYDKGLALQAYQLGSKYAPLARWRGVSGSILAGRIAGNLGAPGICFRQHVSAYHAAPDSLRCQAYYLEVMTALRGPVFSWQKFCEFERAAKKNVQDGGADEGWEYLFTQGARLSGMFRDFERVEEHFKTAEKYPSLSPWALVERATVETMRERWEEGLKLAQQAHEIRPWYRPAIMNAVHCLHTLNRNDEALQLAGEATRHLESTAVWQQLAGLQMDLEKYEEALVTLEQTERSSPLLDKAMRRWINVARCRAACLVDNFSLAEQAAAQVDGEYHQALEKRLREAGRPARRVQLTVPFIKQYRMTCVPATLTMLRRFWDLPADQVEVAEAICYDGTPTHKARRWAEAQGMLAREFTVDWETAKALLDRQIPFAIYTTAATSAHVQVMVGYDELRQVFIIRDPSFPQILEVEAEKFLTHHARSGPAGMVLLPDGNQERIAGLEFRETGLYDHLRQVQEALEYHRREEAARAFNELREKAPGHRLTLTAGRALYSYDTNSPALLDCFNQLLAQYPADGNVLLAKLGCLREIGRREDRLEFLKQICLDRESDAVFLQQWAEELMRDARQNAAAALALKKSLRFQPFNPATLGSLANLYWAQQRFEEAVHIYRFAACIDDKKEPAARAFFTAATACRQSDIALSKLQQRFEQNIAASPWPFITWFHALQQIGRVSEALAQLERVLEHHQEHGELWLCAADTYSRHGDFTKAEHALAQAESRVRRNAFLKTKADLARHKTDGKSAAALFREILETEPLSMDAHQALVWLLAEIEGRPAALDYLREICSRFPHHYQLQKLYCEWARPTNLDVAEEAARRLVAAHPTDAWARRELALILTDTGRPHEASVEAEEGLRLAPHQPASYLTRAHVRQESGELKPAQEDYRAAIRLMVDAAPAIHGLVNSCATLAERRESLAFIEQELVRQVVHGQGLQAYRDAARLNLEPQALLASLRVALEARPDLATAWSVVVSQLAQMLELEEALKLAQEATRRFPLLENAWLDLATVHRLRLDDIGERAALEQGLRVDPTSNTSAQRLAERYQRLGEVGRARELYEEGCAREPLNAYCHGSLALIMWQQQQRPEAIRRIQHAIKILPDYGWGWRQLSHWTTANGQPKLAEELAQVMVLQRPGDVRVALVLARLLTGGNRLAEALSVVNRAIKDFPRSVEAHELHVEILDRLGRKAEADAACEPEIWAHRIPAGLRAHRARLEADRGNMVSAIERMKEVLQENPGYIGGWQSLADWYWRRSQFDEALAAATNIRQLDPLNPVPLGYRASMKIQRKDHAGAKGDLLTALKLDPGYTYASLNLFELQLADAEIDAAWKTLNLIKRYAENDKAKACEVKLRSRYLQISSGVKKSNAKAAPIIDAAGLDGAFHQLEALACDAQAEGENIDVAVEAVLAARQGKRLDKLLNRLIQAADCNPRVGTWWMKRRIKKGKWYSTSKVNRLCASSPAARRAVICLIEKLGDPFGPISRTIALVYVIIIFTRMVDRLWRAFALRWLTIRHRKWLRQDNSAWATVGLVLVRLSKFQAATRWMQDWANRTELSMWMLYNLALALHHLGQWQEAKAVLDAAVKLPAQDHTFDGLRLLLAYELAAEGQTAKAAGHLRELNTQAMGKFLQIQLQFVRGMIAVQQARPEDRKRVFKAERKSVKEMASRYKLSTYRADYRRCMIRMARDADQPWMIFLTRIGI
jgi:cellulose synthase operon protein C